MEELMGDKLWKQFERRIARYFGTTRNPLSGSNGKHSESDSLHPRLYIEAKLRQKFSVITLFDDTNIKAKKEKKIPVVCLTEKNRKGFYILVHSSQIKEVANEVIDEADPEHNHDDSNPGGTPTL
jgi:hypothetical protein